MPENPVDVVAELLGDMANRVGEYAEIWQGAAARNAAHDYGSQDLAADVLRAGGLAMRDMANVGVAFLSVLGSVARPAPAAPKRPTAKKPQKKTGAKKTAASKSPK